MNSKNTSIILLFLLPVFIFAQEIIIKDINFEGTNVTSINFLKKIITIKPGDVWNASTKNTVLTKVNAQRYIIDTATIREDIINENEVIITIVIQEKLSFIVIPFFTYSNSQGLKPKLIFRHYNVGGWGKYLGAKLEFLPTSHIGVNLDWYDNYFLNIENLIFSINLSAATSYLNYNLDSTTSIPPIGVITWDGKWSKINNHVITSAFSLNYTVPNYDIKINSNIALNYKVVEVNEEDKAINDVAPVHYFTPSASLGVNIPVTPYFNFGSTIKYRHETELNNKFAFDVPVENNEKINYFHEIKNLYNPTLSLDFVFPNTEYAYSIGFTLIGNFTTQSNQVITSKEVSFNTENIHKNFTNHVLNLGVTGNFTKRFNINPNLANTIIFSNTIIQRAFDYNDAYQNYIGKNYELWKDVSNTIQLDVNFTNQLDYRFYKRHHYMMRFKLFYYYNDTNTYDNHFKLNEKINAEKIAAVEKRIYRVDSDYVMGSNTGDFEGYAGTLLNIAYKLPLFNFTTPSFLTYQLKKPLEWDAFFTFFLDVGLAQNYTNFNYDNKEANPYIETLKTEKLNLYPGLAGGVKFQIIPRFVPALIEVQLGIDVWKIFKGGGFSGNLVFSFGIDNQ